MTFFATQVGDRVGELVTPAVVVVVVVVIPPVMGLADGLLVKVLGAAETDGALVTEGELLGAADSDGALLTDGEVLGLADSDGELVTEGEAVGNDPGQEVNCSGMYNTPQVFPKSLVTKLFPDSSYNVNSASDSRHKQVGSFTQPLFMIKTPSTSRAVSNSTCHHCPNDTWV